MAERGCRDVEQRRTEVVDDLVVVIVIVVVVVIVIVIVVVVNFGDGELFRRCIKR